MHSFLLSELKIATDLLGDGCSSYLESNIAKAIHPSLCPILILLSRLKPSATSSGADDALDPSLFIPFIQRCETQSNLRVRVLASRALTGLVSVEKLQTVICSVGHDLPHERRQLAIPSEAASLNLYQSGTASNGFGNASTCTISFNSIHGLLLQLSSLLDNNCRDLTDLSMKEEILGELIDVLFHCNWIGRTRSCSCPILNSSYIHVLDLMLDISKSYTSQHTPRIRCLLLQLSLECLDEDKNPLLAWYDPTIVELRRQATLSYFNCLMGRNYVVPEACSQLLNMSSSDEPTKEVLDVGPSVSELQQMILSSILDPTYEVQLAALKKLLQLVNSLTLSCQSGVLHLWARSNLHSVLIKLLFLEENPKCTYYVLKIFFNWNTQQLEKPTDLQCSIAADCDFLFRLWDRLVSIYETVKRIKTREIALCCMGVCIKQFVHLLNSSLFTGEYQIIEEPANDTSEGNQSAKWIGALRCIDFFVILVNSHSSPSEPVNLRKAAAEAIVASGLLSELMPIALIVSNNHATFEETDNISIEIFFECHMPEVVSLYACRILHLWFSCIQLLEDEDNGLRQKLAKDVQNCIATDRSSNTDAVPTQVDRVIELSFNFLSSACGHWFEYMKYLANWVLRTGSSVSSYGDLVRQVFDKEIDNHHEEKLLICQLCCLHLGNLLASNSSEVQVNHQGLSYSCIQKFSSVMRLNFLRQLISLSKSFLETEGITDWIGGIGNHKNAFVCVYANLLGIYALSQPPHELNKLGCPADSNKLYLLEFGELEQVIRPFLRNPLINNLYDMVMELHQRMLGVSQTGYKSDGFDPYFLLR